MSMTIQATAYKLADLEHEIATHSYQLADDPNSAFIDELNTRWNELRDSIPDDVLLCPEFLAAYDERRAERNARAERGQLVTVIEGGTK